jgi:MerR family copper efflux transcriptional regulator
MSSHGHTIAEAATSLGVSTRTIRRLIRSGRIQAELVPGKFGQEYRILELPSDVYGAKARDHSTGDSAVDTPVQMPVQTASQFMDLVRELQDRNLALAAQLGAATERIRSLESQVRLLTIARRPWWERLFKKKRASS